MSSEPQGADGARLVSLANEEAVKEILATTVLDLWKVVNNLTRLRPSKRDRYRVADAIGGIVVRVPKSRRVVRSTSSGARS